MWFAFKALLVDLNWLCDLFFNSIFLKSVQKYLMFEYSVQLQNMCFHHSKLMLKDYFVPFPVFFFLFLCLYFFYAFFFAFSVRLILRIQCNQVCSKWKHLKWLLFLDWLSLKKWIRSLDIFSLWKVIIWAVRIVYFVEMVNYGHQVLLFLFLVWWIYDRILSASCQRIL
jgi:hypothetical protein